VERTVIERVVRGRTSSPERGLGTTDSQAKLLLGLGWATATRAAVMSGLSERGVIVRAGTALGEEGRMRVTYGTRHEKRALPSRPSTRVLATL